ncbi:hypothetical protein H0264_18600 [Nocardia huaxiensis]|uniref:Uncharacterized protein n=1 Tax=Nocardia huaxiensis TaxID=2755382 RepID=A0A7D6VF72_9NOCA|nr:hypothetical protein [Nocardia huaxiensis]QLY33971.1 hypothetical protein H0264_18600 [Nocardia huaxiensis]
MTRTNFGQRFTQAAAKIPSAFGKNSTPGTTVYGRITNIGEQPKLKYGGAPGEIDTDEHGNTVMQLFITLDTPTGAKNLYPTSRMEQAIGQAMNTAGATSFDVGATLSVTYTGPDPDNVKARLYTAVYTPAAANGGGR